MHVRMYVSKGWARIYPCTVTCKIYCAIPIRSVTFEVSHGGDYQIILIKLIMELTTTRETTNCVAT
jgi:hypothetical protein